MCDNYFGRRRYDPDDLAQIMEILQDNKEALDRISRTSYMSRSRVISLAIQHFGSLSLDEQLKLLEKHLPR